MAKTVFISYSSADRMEALSVRRLLADRGCTVWLDVFDIRISGDVKSELGQGVAGADVLCLLLSPTAVASPWVAEEIARGREQESKRGLRIVPVLLRPCRPPDTLLGTVMLDATEGIGAPDVQARLAKAVLGEQAVSDRQIDAAMQEALQARQDELEAAGVLPELAGKLDEIRDRPIRKIQISFRHTALLHGQALAVGLEFDRMFSQPMWFLFAHYREGHTWPKWMKLEERDHQEIRIDNKRIDGRFQWFDRIVPLNEQLDGTDLRDLPATFHYEFNGEKWQPGGSISSYEGGPTVPHLAQQMEIPPLAKLLEKRAVFGITIFGKEEGSSRPVPEDQNDFDIRVIAEYGPSNGVVLYRSTHNPLERVILKGGYLSGRASGIERDAILGLYPRVAEVELADRAERRKVAHALLEKPEEELSPEERRTVARLRHEQAVLDVFRVFGSAPPPGPARTKLHTAAIEECRAVWRLLEPFVAADPELDDVGMSFWAASNLANYYQAGRDAARARPYAEAALDLVRQAAERDTMEPEYRRWVAAALERLAQIQAAGGDADAALAALAESIGVLRGLHAEMPNAGRRKDLQQALTSAIKSAGRWKPGDPLAELWTGVAAELNPAAAGQSGRGA